MRAWLVVGGLVSFALGCTSETGDAGEGGASEGGGAVSGGTGGLRGSGGATVANGSGGSGGAGGEAPGIPCEANGRAGTCELFDACTGDGQAPVAGFCPGPAEVQCCAELPAGTCDPDATPLPNFDVQEPAGTGGCLPGMLAIGGFCIDRYEAALVRFPDFGPVSPYFNPGDEEVVAVSAPGLVPQGYIDQVRAGDACTNAGKRLCTDAEWLRACEGPNGTTYPYGDAREPGVCNDARSVHPAVEYFMTTDSWIYGEIDHPCLNQLEDGLDPTGANVGCVTAEGAFDMMGNLHEWTADPNGTFRGGFYVDTKLNGNGCLYVTTAHDVSHFDYSTGFRCCSDL
jgi:hypothetical protein